MNEPNPLERQKQPRQVFYEKSVLKKFAKFTGKGNKRYPKLPKIVSIKKPRACNFI